LAALALAMPAVVNQRSQAQGEVDSGADTGGCDDGAVHDDALRDWYRAQGTKVI
jgi:hypothetical protein